MTESPPRLEEEILLQIHRDSVDRLHAELEAAGGDIAKKSRELRVLYSQLLRSDVDAKASGYYRRFDDPLDALLVFLLNVGKTERSFAVRTILDGGYTGKTNNPERSLTDAIYYQTKPKNNGKYRIKAQTDGMLMLTDMGKQEAKKIVSKYGTE